MLEPGPALRTLTPAHPIVAASLEDPLWAVVLAGGDGSRLASLTRGRGGAVVPKQYCSLEGGPTLLESAIERGTTLAGPARTCAVVADAHRCWWSVDAHALPASNVHVQPQNRGTAVGILLALLRLLEHGRNAQVLLLPADHYIEDEALLQRAIREADRSSRAYPDDLTLVGMAPEWPDPELGYIVPAAEPRAALRKVERFVEKPPAQEAERLLALGALWNSFIVLGRARALMQMFLRRMPDVVGTLRGALALDRRGQSASVALARRYRELPSVDFSRDLLMHESPRLRVAKAPQCGWTDLGAPERLSETLRRRQLEQPRTGAYLAAMPLPPRHRHRPVLARQLQLTDAGAVPRTLAAR